MKKLWIIALAALSGCASQQPISVAPISLPRVPPADLVQPCPALPQLPAGEASIADLFENHKAVTHLYATCSALKEKENEFILNGKNSSPGASGSGHLGAGGDSSSN